MLLAQVLPVLEPLEGRLFLDALPPSWQEPLLSETAPPTLGESPFAGLTGSYTPTYRAGLEAVLDEGLREFVNACTRVGPDAYRDNPDGMILGWAENFVLEGFLSMYEATGDVRYLERVMDDIDHMLPNRSDRLGRADAVRGKMMRAWVTDFRPGYPTGVYYAYVVHNANILYQMARWVYLVRRDPLLREALSAKADAYEQAIRETIEDLDIDWRTSADGSEAWYIERTDYDRPLPFNQQNAMGRVFVAMYLATGEDVWKGRAAQLAAYFANRLFERDGGWVWRYKSTASVMEDLWHGGIAVDFAVQAYRAGIAFTEADMLKFARTFANLTVRNAQGAPIGWYEKLDATSTVAYNGAILWVRLGFFDAQIARDVAAYISYHRHETAGFLAEQGLVFQMESPVPPPAPPPALVIPGPGPAAQAGDEADDETAPADDVAPEVPADEPADAPADDPAPAPEPEPTPPPAQPDADDSADEAAEQERAENLRQREIWRVKVANARQRLAQLRARRATAAYRRMRTKIKAMTSARAKGLDYHDFADAYTLTRA